MTKFNVGDTVRIVDDAFVDDEFKGKTGVVWSISMANSIDPVFFVDVPCTDKYAQCWDDEITLVQAVQP